MEKSPATILSAKFSTLEVAPHDAPQLSTRKFALQAQKLPQLLTRELPPTPESGLPFHKPYNEHNQSHKSEDNTSTEKRIYGLRVHTFWLSLMLSIILVLAIIGFTIGGVFASKFAAKQRAESNSAAKSTSPTNSSSTLQFSTTPTSTSSQTQIQMQTQTQTQTQTQAPKPSPSFTTTNTCPQSNGTNFTAPRTNSVFRITCGLDWTNGTRGDGVIVRDLVGILADTLEHCIAACGSYNLNQGDGDCKAVSYTADLTAFWVVDQKANCFLKNGKGVGKAVDRITVAELLL